MDSAGSRHGMQRCLLSSHYFPAFGLEWNKMEEEVVIKSYHVIRKKELKRKLHREHKRESQKRIQERLLGKNKPLQGMAPTSLRIAL